MACPAAGTAALLPVLAIGPAAEGREGCGHQVKAFPLFLMCTSAEVGFCHRRSAPYTACEARVSGSVCVFASLSTGEFSLFSLLVVLKQFGFQA